MARVSFRTSTHAFVVDILREAVFPGVRAPLALSAPPSAGVEAAAWNV
jgi:hypothetical protein